MLRADADGRRRAEHAEIDARQRERRASLATARSHIETSWHPAAVAMPVHARDDRLRHARDRQHHAAAVVEQLALPASSGVRAQLLQVVPGAEAAALGGEHDDAHRRVVGDAVELGLQRSDHAARQSAL